MILDPEALEAERVRLEAIVIEQQTEMKALEQRNDNLKRELLEKGETNARLNRDLQRARRQMGLPDNA